MNNYEHIKAMSIEEMILFLADRQSCGTCNCDMEENKCMAIGCKDGIKQWLESEVEECIHL